MGAYRPERYGGWCGRGRSLLGFAAAGPSPFAASRHRPIHFVMTPQEALDWCARHAVQISFRSVPDEPRVRLTCGDHQACAEKLTLAARRLQRAMNPRPEDDETPLSALTYEGRNCEGRVLRLARAIGVETVEELMAWTQAQPNGLAQITRYPNIGRRSLERLERALRRHGVEEIPGCVRA